jgi:hypothetical protein
MDMKYGKIDLGRKYVTKGNAANIVNKVISSVVPTIYRTLNNTLLQALPFCIYIHDFPRTKMMFAYKTFSVLHDIIK